MLKLIFSFPMKIAIAADHAGFALKERLRCRLAEQGHDVTDFGTYSDERCDYPDYAEPVARGVAGGKFERGILVCYTGIGMAIAANKAPGVRATPTSDEDVVRLTRDHNDANILALGARYVDEDQAMRLIQVFLETGFAGGRHSRRLEKIAAMEAAVK